MEFSEEWKSLFPITPVHTPPLFLSSPSSLGPLFFTPTPSSLSLLTSSPLLSPPFLLPPPSLSLPRFLSSATSYSSSSSFPILPTHSHSISSSFLGPQPHNPPSPSLSNRLERLFIPSLNWVLVFFPTGSNLDRVGFLVLSVQNSRLALVDFPQLSDSIFPHFKADHQIIRLAAFGLDDEIDDVGSVGYLVVCTNYSAHWFSVRINDARPSLVCLGSKVFKSCAVVCASWSPHLPGECVVLLESGEMFLFDMDSSGFKGKRMCVAWDQLEDLGSWFGCEFSWHPRILVVANSKAVFLVDFRFGKCQPCCLAKVDAIGMYDMPEKERFVAISKAGKEGFLFAVGSNHWVVLIDVRKPLFPILRWAQNLHEPCYLTVLPLSELRANPSDEKYAEVSEMGYAIAFGSFWNNEFNVFCYGRPPPGELGPFSAKMSKFSNSIYAWELPSEISLSGQNCGCGTCLLKGEFMKDNLPEWVDWQQKKDSVLGFFVLNNDLSSLLPKPGEHGGFTLVRLMSSGELEMQQYCASWKVAMSRATGHQVKSLYSQDSLLCPMGDEEYKFARRFGYVELKYLYGHLKDDLARLLFFEYKNTPAITNAEECPNKRTFEVMTRILESFRLDKPDSLLSASDIQRYVNMPSSLYEIAGRLMWIGLPISILQAGFPDLNKVLGVVDDREKVCFEVPPFFLRSPSHQGNKGTTNGLVPLPASLVLSKISKHGYSFVAEVNKCSPEEEIALKCKSVLKSIKQVDCSTKLDEELAVSLKEDKDETWAGLLEARPLFSYEPSAFADDCFSCTDDVEDAKLSVQDGKRFNTIVAKLTNNEEVKLSPDKKAIHSTKIFDDVCPVKLNFNCDDLKFSETESNVYIFLKNQFSKWQQDYIPYQNLCERLKPN